LFWFNLNAMKISNGIIVSVFAFASSVSNAFADDFTVEYPLESMNTRGIEIFDPNAKPHLDSDNNSLVDAISSLNKICEIDELPLYMNSLCDDVRRVVNHPNECFDIYDENLPLVMAGCQTRVGLDIALGIQNIFNQGLLGDGSGNCRGGLKQQSFTFTHGEGSTIFAFPCQPI